MRSATGSMIKKRTAILALAAASIILMAGKVVAQTDQSEIKMSFYWPEIIRCASLPLPGFKDGEPGMDNMLSWQWKTMQSKFSNIQLCRQLLAAYSAGFSAATAGAEALPEVPMSRPDDMKVFCRFENHLDKNGAGWTACYLPGER